MIASTVRCPRCDTPVEQDTVEIAEFGGQVSHRRIGSLWCPTGGCVDEHGSDRVIPPPTGAEMLRAVEEVWWAHQLDIAGEPPTPDGRLWRAVDRALSRPPLAWPGQFIVWFARWRWRWPAGVAVLTVEWLILSLAGALRG